MGLPVTPLPMGLVEEQTIVEIHRQQSKRRFWTRGQMTSSNTRFKATHFGFCPNPPADSHQGRCPHSRETQRMMVTPKGAASSAATFVKANYANVGGVISLLFPAKTD